VKNPYNPESNPTCPVVEVEAKDLHGLAKVDCVTVWFFCWNWKVTVSPALAVMLLGVKKSFPVPPTTTWWLLLRGGVDEEEAEGYAGEAAELAEGAPGAALALAWYVARSLPGLTAKTMPDWQCVLCLQNTQTLKQNQLVSNHKREERRREERTGSRLCTV
jgi:hypothetical protein